MNAVAEAFTSGVLDSSVHGRLVQNLGAFARRANIPEEMILHKMSKYGCSSDEIAYVKKLNTWADKGAYGLVYEGAESNPVMPRMMAITGACLRNFVEAKMLTVQELMEAIKKGDAPDCRVLLIPNFFVSRSEGIKIAEWHVAELLGMLYTRMARGQQTMLYVSDMKSLRKTYGDQIANHLENHFRMIPA